VTEPNSSLWWCRINYNRSGTAHF